MAERKSQCRVIYVDYVCDKCNTGLMVPSSMELSTWPPLYPSECNNCSHSAALYRRYPDVRFENTGELIPNG